MTGRVNVYWVEGPRLAVAQTVKRNPQATLLFHRKEKRVPSPRPLGPYSLLRRMNTIVKTNFDNSSLLNLPIKNISKISIT